MTTDTPRTEDSTDARALDRLFQTIQDRWDADPSHSYTAKLRAKGRAKIAQKVGEEAVETVIEGVDGTPESLAAESADLLYHLLVLWAERGVKPSDVYAVLEGRGSVGGLEEKKSRKVKQESKR